MDRFAHFIITQTQQRVALDLEVKMSEAGIRQDDGLSCESQAVAVLLRTMNLVGKGGDMLRKCQELVGSNVPTEVHVQSSRTAAVSSSSVNFPLTEVQVERSNLSGSNFSSQSDSTQPTNPETLSTASSRDASIATVLSRTDDMCCIGILSMMIFVYQYHWAMNNS